MPDFPPRSRLGLALLGAALLPPTATHASVGTQAPAAATAAEESRAATALEAAAARIEDGRYADALAAIERGLSTAVADGRGRWLQLRGRALRMAGRGQEDEALASALESARLARESGDAAWNASAELDLGALCMQRGETDEARAALDAARDLCLGIGPPADALRADVLVYRSVCCDDDADPRTRADALLREAAAIQAQFDDQLDPRIAFRLTREANRAHRDGAYRRALDLGLQALAAFRARLRPDHPRIALALHNLGTYHKELRDLPAAAQALAEALEIRAAEGSPLAGRTLMLLAQVRDELGDAEEARRLHEQSIAWIERSDGPESLALCVPLRALADAALRGGDADLAEAQAQRALAILARDPDRFAEERASLHDILGGAEWLRGRRDRAAATWEQALAILAAAGMDDALPAVDVLCQIGLATASSGRLADAERGAALVERALAIQRRVLGESHPDVAWTLAAFSEVSHAAGRGALAFACALDAAAIVRRHLDANADRLDERDALGYVTELTPGLPSAVVLATEDPAARASLAWEAVVAARAAVFESVRRRRTRARGDEIAPDPPGIGEIARARPAGAALVAYVRCARPDAYVAFALRPGSAEPVAVDLGSAAEIDALVAPVRMLTRAPGSEAVLRRAAGALRARVWDPVADVVSGADEIHVVPDGALLFVDFAALPVGEAGYLIETAGPIHVLGSERDLLRARARRDVAADPGRFLLAVGGPDYGAAPPGADAADGERTRTPRATFGPLPLAGDEARAVAELWSHGAVPPRVLVGSAATEAAFRAGLRGARVLHVATHGYAEAAAAPRGARGLAAEPGGAPLVAPLRLGISRLHVGRSGLALAGANSLPRRDATDDGLLSDADVMALDLDGLDLAVLSACDSGAGEVQSGEGMFGLRRAFQVAGAHTVVGSLWPVADETARTIMADFHARLLADGDSVARALHGAKLAELGRLRAAGLDTHPWHWAGFVAAGEPGRVR